MAIYWSEAVKLKKMQVAAVDATKDPVEWANCIIFSAITFNKPQDSITPPKIIAHKISHIVFSITLIPYAVSRSVIMGSLV
jgi:hypothetical protein